MNRLRFLSITLMIVPLYAPVTPINSIDRFDQQVTRNDMVVAYLYQPAQEKCDKKELKKQLDAFKTVSRQGRYQDTGIKFMSANLAKDGLCVLETRHDLQADNNFLLFYKGDREEDLITGRQTPGDLEAFIENSWGGTIDDILKEQEEERKRIEAQQRLAYAYWGPSWGCGYGCGYGCGWGDVWGGPCFSAGCYWSRRF